MRKINNLFNSLNKVPILIANIPKYKTGKFLNLNLIVNLGFGLYFSFYLLLMKHVFTVGLLALAFVIGIGIIMSLLKFCSPQGIKQYFKQPRIIDFNCQTISFYSLAINIVLVITLGSNLL